MIPDMNVLRMAYLIEEDFREYYKMMAGKVEDSELKEILTNFAAWEDGHAKIFKDEYDKLMDKYMNMSWGGWLKEKSAIVLSGGKSTRMGKDKQMLNYKGIYLIDTLIENLSKNFEEIIIVSNKKDFFKNRYDNYEKKILIVSDIIKEMGPCGGLFTGLISSVNEDNFLIACDMPYFNQAYLDFLKTKAYEKALVYKNEKYYQPFFAFYKKDLANNLEKYLQAQKRSLNGFLEEISPTLIKEEEIRIFKNYQNIFRNLNYPEDWQKFLKEKNNGFN